MRFRRPKGWERPEALPRGYGIDPLALKQWDATPSNGFGGGAQFDTPLVNVDGLDFTGVNPSDTNGDVGIDHYVQSINNSASSGILILNKADGTTAAQFVLDDIAAGSGTGCGGGRGDPVIMYDQYVDNGPGNPKGRWVLTEFTSTSLCIYISVTESPIGPTNDSTWHIYEFNSASGGLPDYPKFGVWRDAYYMGANESNRQYAFDRDNMINGDPARGYQVFSTVGLPGFGFQHLMPADADGETLPPAVRRVFSCVIAMHSTTVIQAVMCWRFGSLPPILTPLATVRSPVRSTSMFQILIPIWVAPTLVIYRYHSPMVRPTCFP